jgi:Domain of Unknown Function with PDB structure (DUF3857)
VRDLTATRFGFRVCGSRMSSNNALARTLTWRCPLSNVWSQVFETTTGPALPVAIKNLLVRAVPCTLLMARKARTNMFCLLTAGRNLRSVVFGLVVCLPGALRADGFQPVSPDELKLASEPLAQGAPAIILYRQVDRDDSSGASRQFNYVRIKILNEEGRKYADVEIPFFTGSEEISHINARTVKPDGSIVNFDGKIFDKSLVKVRQFGVSAKTFSMPDVEPGGIIEYFYTEQLKTVWDSQWILSGDFFTKNAKFSLRPFGGYGRVYLNVRVSTHDLPPGVAPPNQGSDHIIRLEASNIPAFQKEDHVPPVNELKSRVDFIYVSDDAGKDPDKFWRTEGKRWNDYVERFVDKHKAMEQAVSEIVAPTDPAEVKLRKIYARVQEIRNKSFEIRKTQQEEKRDKEKPDLNVEDVWKRGYGYDNQLAWLYLALTRAAGFESYGCLVSNRSQYFFDPKTMQSAKLRSGIVLVKLDGKDLFLAPGTEFAPFGMLTWSETGVQGLCLEKDGGIWIKTPVPRSSESRIERNAKLKLTDAGDLEGKLTVTYSGLEAMYHRLDVRHSDDVARKKFAEDAVIGQIPAAARAELTNKPDWSDSDTPLVAEFDVKVPSWASNAGKRVMVPAALFTAHEKHIFEHANRVYPVYFEYPYEKWDDVTVELPKGWQTASVPAEETKDGRIVSYDLKTEDGKTTIHTARKLKIDFVILEPKYYPSLRVFFQAVRTADEEQIVVQADATSASK